MSFSFLGDLFDLNGDRKLDCMEQAMDEHAFYMMMKSMEEKEEPEFMDEGERRETLENAGLDPDDYDFY